MKIKHRIDKIGLHIYLQGELDEFFQTQVKEQIDNLIENNLNIQSVIFDMSGLTFMDSTGIGILIGRYKKLKKMKIPCFIANPSFSADKVFTISGIYDLIPRV
ncbi:MAG: STAS domain-containing protein [Clostridia bacterium]|nr:STAS domain-containing protein [Clostridia bacterium]